MTAPSKTPQSLLDELHLLRQRVAELERERAQRRETDSLAQAADQHYRLLYEHTPSMYFSLLPDGTVLSVNQYGAKHLGYGREELIGRSVLNVFAPPDHPTVLSQLALCADHPSKVFEWEIGKIRKDGSPLWVKERAQAVPDDTGRLMILVVCEDISGQHEAERLKAKADESLRELTLALSRAMPGISRLDLEGRYVSANEYYADQLGYLPAELIGRPWHQSVHAEDHVRAEEAYRHMCRTGEAEFEALAVRKDGSHFHKHVFMVRIEDTAGRMIGHHCFMRNITERKQTEQELHMVRERLQNLVASSPAIVYASKPCADYGATYISENVTEQLGYQPSEFTEDSGFWAAHIHPDDRARVFAEMPALFRDGTHETDYRFQHKNGTYRWMHDRIRLLRDAAGHPVEIVGSWIDITERMEAELALRESEQRFHKAFRSSPHPIGITELGTGICVEANDVCLAVFGFSREEVVGTSTLDLHIWPDPDDRARFVGKLRESGAIRNMEISLRTKSGETRHFLFSSELIDLKGVPCIVTVGNDITDRKRAEDRLSLTQYAVDHADDGIFLIGSDGYFLDVNESACRRLGYTKQELLTMSVMDIDPDFPPEIWDSFWAEFKATKRINLETRHRSKSGEIYPVEVTANYFLHNGRELDYAIVRDITDRKRAEAELKRSHDFLRQVLDIAPNFIFAKDRSGRFTMVNQAVADVYGTTVENLVGKTDADFNPNRAEVEFFLNMDREVMDSQRERFIPEEVITDAAGNIRWLQTVKRPILDEAGRATQVLGAATDITERKQAETALRESEQRLRRFFDEAPVGLTILDREMRLIKVNRAFCTLTGYSEEEILGRTYEFYTHPDDLPGNLVLTESFYRGERPGYSLEKRYVKKCGETIWVSVNATRFELLNFPNPLLLAAVQDITDRKLAVEQRERLSQDLHDNLLQSLYAVGMQLEASRLASGPSSKQAKAHVAQAIEQLNRLVLDVRNFIAVLKRQPVPGRDFGMAMRQLVHSLLFTAGAAPDLHIDDAAARPLTAEQTDQMLNIAREALSNSLRHAQATARWVRLYRTGDTTQLEIGDNGRGFSPGKTNGTGHGLAHMADRAARIGGQFRVDSAPGQGTRIVVEFPTTEARSCG